MIIMIRIVIMNTQNKLYTIQFFSPSNDQFTMQKKVQTSIQDSI